MEVFVRMANLLWVSEWRGLLLVQCLQRGNHEQLSFAPTLVDENQKATARSTCVLQLLDFSNLRIETARKEIYG